MLRLLATHHHAVQENERFYVLIQPDYGLLVAETCCRWFYIKTLNCVWRICWAEIYEESILNEDRAASFHVPSNSLLSNLTTRRDAVSY
jgi:hypothetical protein